MKIMKKCFLHLFALTFFFALFCSCSDDDKGSNSKVLMAEVSGTYQGDLSVTMEPVLSEKSNRNIYIVEDGTSTVKMELKDFSIQIGNSLIEVGDIIVPNIELTGEGSLVTLKETHVVINHPDLGELQVKISGTVIDGKADLYIVVFAKTLNQNINVQFEGKRISKDILISDYAEEVAAWYARTDLTVSGADIDAIFPSDGISVIRKGYNKIGIESTPFSFPPHAVYIAIESAELVKTAEGLSIESVKKEFTDKTYGNVKVTLSGKIVDKVMTLDIIISNETNTITYKYVGEQRKTGAEITKMTINNEAIRVQPEISSIVSLKSNVVFYVKDGISDLSFVPEFEISEGATLNYGGEPYVKGTKVDFSTSKEFKVVSESGKKTVTYTISVQELLEFVFATNFDNAWKVESYNNQGKILYEEPGGGWGTSNGGVAYIKGMNFILNCYSPDKPNAVVAAENGTGKAARLETLHTTGKKIFGIAVPVVTSGTVFTGIFKVVISNTLESTQFGYPCFKKPMAFKGTYKFTPGDVYYYCPDPIENAQVANVDNTKKDLPAMNAVLYEVNSYAFDVLNGTNLLTSDRIVAKASVDGKVQTEYTDFNVPFTFLENKTFDPSKKYKVAIVCSSSKDGDKFSGAPGSVLYVDNLEVTF